LKEELKEYDHNYSLLCLYQALSASRKK